MSDRVFSTLIFATRNFSGNLTYGDISVVSLILIYLFRPSLCSALLESLLNSRLLIVVFVISDRDLQVHRDHRDETGQMDRR